MVFSGNDSDGPGKAAEFLIAQTKQKFLGKANKKTSKKAKKAAAAAAAAASAANETVKDEEKPAVNNSLTAGAEVNGVGGKPSKQQGANSVKPHSITETEDQIMVSTSTAESEEEEDERPLAAAMSKKLSPSKTAAASPDSLQPTAKSSTKNSKSSAAVASSHRESETPKEPPKKSPQSAQNAALKGLSDSLSRYFTPGDKRTSRTALAAASPVKLSQAVGSPEKIGSIKRKRSSASAALVSSSEDDIGR